MANKPYVGFNVDASEVAALSGFLKTLSLKIGTSRHIGPVLKYTHAVMSEEFSAYMSTIAPAQQSRFHHVYEWGQAGDPTAQLWQDKLVGNGNNRIATFVWKASKQIVPVRDDFLEAGVKPIHIFVWKAPVMEYGKNIKIEPKRGKFLSYFTGPTNPPGKYEMKITKNPIVITHPGGKLVKGSFTKEYVGWWAGAGAEAVFKNTVKRVLENDLGKMPIESATKPFRRSRTKTFAIGAVANYDAAEEAGSAAAKKYLEARSRKYIEAAKARERIIYG